MIYNRLIIDGNAVYEIDDECMRRKQGRMPEQNLVGQKQKERQEKEKRK